MPKKSDLLNRKFGKLTVVKDTGTRTKHGQVEWLCRCECGNEAIRYSAQLLSMNVQSCGCLRAERLHEATFKHGMQKTKEYSSWYHLLSRCRDKNNTRYHRYGGRGITVCQRWQDDFRNFLEDMGKIPGPGYSIERIDNDKGYTPENCKWASREEQDNNKGVSNFLTWKGKTQTITLWARELGISLSTLRWRLRGGWSLEEALSTPTQRKGFRRKKA